MSEPQGDEPTVAFFFCELQRSQNTDPKIDASWGFKFFNKVDMTQEMWNEAVQRKPWTLVWVPDQYKTQEMCNKAVQGDPWMLEHVPDQFATQKMCIEAVQREPWTLVWVPDQYKTQER